jgi:hypothetical protein
VLDTLHKGHQAMVFVHSRKDTGKTARTLVAKAQNGGDTEAFDCTQHEQYPFMLRDIRKSRNRCARLIRLPPDLATAARYELPSMAPSELPSHPLTLDARLEGAVILDS